MATAKELRPVLRAALLAGFTERGWKAVGRGGTVFQRRVPETELVLGWDTEAEGYKYGGMWFGGGSSVTAPELLAELLTFPDDAWVECDRRLAPGDRAAWASITSTTTGELTDARGNFRKWVAQTEEELESAVGEFFAMIDGPFTQWVRSVTPIGRLLDWAIWGRGRSPLAETSAELIALLAVRNDRPSVARAVLEAARRSSREPEVLDVFERELRTRYPGALERADADPPKEHPLWRPLADALWTGFGSRGWSPSATRSGAFELERPGEGLVMSWTPAVEVEGGGGLRFGGVGVLTAPAATETLLGFPAETRPWAFDHLDDRAAHEVAWLGVETAGRLTDHDGDEPLWTVRTRDDVETAAAAFFAMVDGPLARWLATTGTLDQLLASAEESPRELRPSRVRYELLALLALEHRRPKAARAAIRTGMRNLRDPIGRFGRFDNELATRFRSYGRPQVQNGPGGAWLIDRAAR